MYYIGVDLGNFCRLSLILNGQSRTYVVARQFQENYPIYFPKAGLVRAESVMTGMKMHVWKA